MKKPIVFWIVFMILSSLVPVSARVMKGLSLEEGQTEENRIRSPVLDASGVGAVSFGEFRSTQGPDDHIAYMMHKSQLTAKPKYKQPRFELAPSIDLGALFAEALRSEAAAMGFAGDSDNGWKVSGALHHPVVEFRTSGGGWGPLLFYGYMELELTIEDASGNRSSERLKTYNMSHHYNAGFGVQDEVRAALALFLVESAQEVVARLNRKHFKAPPHPGVADTLRSLRANSDDMENPLRVIGLSGSREAVPKLLELLAQEKDEGDRVEIINTLALIGSEEAFPVLARRYGEEDKDCRVFTLKAMDYLGTDEARTLIEQNGIGDDHLPCQVIARRAVR